MCEVYLNVYLGSSPGSVRPITLVHIKNVYFSRLFVLSACHLKCKINKIIDPTVQC